MKKNNHNSIKLIKYFKLINHNLIYNNKAINRYKKDTFEISSDKVDNLNKLRKSINNIKNCSLKKNATNMVFSDGNPKSKIMLKRRVLMKMKKVCRLLVELELYLIKCLLQ